jgi:hypothetical protein
MGLNMATLQDILSGNFPAAQRYAEGYAQMPSYLQDPYLGLSTSQVGNVTKGLLGKTSEVADETKKLLSKKFISNESGKPMTLYHGGPKFEGQFKIPEGSDKGIYFTDNPYFARNVFALQHELAMRDKTGFGYADVPEKMLQSGEWNPKYFKFAEVKKVNLNANNPKTIDALDAKAIPNVYSPEYDAVVVKNTGDFGYKGGQYVVFDPNQIKVLQKKTKGLLSK